MGCFGFTVRVHDGNTSSYSGSTHVHASAGYSTPPPHGPPPHYHPPPPHGPPPHYGPPHHPPHHPPRW